MEKKVQNTIINEHRLAFSDVLSMKEAIINNNFGGQKGGKKVDARTNASREEMQRFKSLGKACKQGTVGNGPRFKSTVHYLVKL